MVRVGRHHGRRWPDCESKKCRRSRRSCRPTSVITSYSIHYTKLYELEPPGSGVVVAALAQVPFEFEEFVRAGRWNPAAFAAAGVHADATGKLLDIVQRMLGPEYFNYDVAAYTVAPAANEAPLTTARYGSTWCWTNGCAFGA